MLLLTFGAARLLWFQTTVVEAGHFSRRCGSAIIVDFMEWIRNTRRIDAVCCSGGITGENATSLLKRRDCLANGCDVLSSLSAEGGFCPVRRVMSPPLCAGSLGGSNIPVKNVYIFSTNLTPCGPALKPLYNKFTHKFDHLNPNVKSWTREALRCPAVTLIFERMHHCHAVKYIYANFSLMMQVYLMKLFNIFSWVLQPLWVPLSLPVNWMILSGCCLP